MSRAKLTTLTVLLTLGIGSAGCSVRTGGDTPSNARGADGEMSTSDCAAYEPSPGVTDDEIKLGSSMPITGALSAAGIIRLGMFAYFDKVNDEGGINGRKINFKVLDDTYDPAKTAQNINRLLVQDQVLALSGTVGTAPVLSYIDSTESDCVPNLMVATGAPVIASEDYQWTLPGSSTYSADAAALAGTAVKTGIKTVALLSQNDDFGRSFVSTFKSELGGSDVKVVTEETYEFSDPTLETQVSKLSSTGADAVFIAALGTKCIQAINGIAATAWRPQILIDDLCTAKPLLDSMEAEVKPLMHTTAWFKNPSDEQWRDDAAMREYRDAVAKYQPDADPSDPSVLKGWIFAQVTAKFLTAASEFELTRASLMTQARSADVHVDTLLDGVNYKVGPDDYAPIESIQVTRFDPDAGDFRGVDPSTGEFLPEREVKLLDFEGQTGAE